ncbi:hypothetical protein ACFQU3_17635 [Terrabacter sp. GCM10028922]|uniref:hypothetical protein n=1 Tax=Terrabacter sp. GCM10028922 TaxID=3273428 RepID=UPI0036068A93
MQPFLHDRLTTYAQLLESSTAAMTAYAGNDLGYATTVGEHLDAVAKAYGAMGTSDAENAVKALGAELVAARRGVEAATGARVETRRREFERSTALRVLLSAADRLRADHAAARSTLDEAKEQLGPVIVFALDHGLMPAGFGTPTQDELEKLWRAILMRPESRGAAQVLAMRLSQPDITLLLAELVVAAGVRD